ncbi:ferredoxin [Streptomyces sp. G44]|uniref:ferredoxin n=1 Tax=Streptomyces sp. G44 TaxID=2807632 RepID=UPI00195F4A80|nr:ferredoxin [Streptomyces sp. G44]MBM7168729.1 ferredoxin [Streptomyces sp. G44]
MEIHIDHRTCIGSGQCTLTAPTVFTQDDDGYAALVPDGARTATPRQVTQAALSCPVQAIAVENDPSDA